MPRAHNLLTHDQVKKAQPGSKLYNLADGGGLVLLVHPSGGKWWRFWYRRPDTRKRNTLSLGTYPDISLADARAKRQEYRTLVAKGIDPGEQRKAAAQASADTFEAIAREWLARFVSRWAPSHHDKILSRLERDIFPRMGGKPIASLQPPDILAALRRIESRGAIDTAHRALQNCGQVFRYAVATGRVTSDVTRDLRGSLAPVKKGHFASITEPAQVGALLRGIEAFTGMPQVAAALQLAPLVFVRPGELRNMEWAELDLDAAEWNIPAHKMKMREPHLVPLSQQAVAILRDLYPLTGSGRYVFPGARARTRPISDMTLSAAFKRMGYGGDQFTAHGFRAMARTMLDEQLHFRPDYIEHQLAHAVRDANGRAYNRTSFLPERKAMMQAWADYLDTLREDDDKVVPIGRRA